MPIHSSSHIKKLLESKSEAIAGSNDRSHQAADSCASLELTPAQAPANQPATPGQSVANLREQIQQTPGDVERRTEEIADRTGDRRYFVSHSQLYKIEQENSVPGIFKICGLAASFGISLEEFLRMYDIDVEMLQHESGLQPNAIAIAAAIPIKMPTLREFALAALKTGLVRREIQERFLQPFLASGPNDLHRYTFGIIGQDDGNESDYVPPGTLVQIDKKYSPGETGVRSKGRPIYFIWYGNGYLCSWCELEGKDLTIIPFGSEQKILRLKIPRDADIIGKVVGVTRFLDSF